MGASESRLRVDDSNEAPRQGYHVVRVAAGSPAHLAGIEPFFDFCVGIDGVALDPTKDVDGAGDTAGLGAWKSLEEREGTQVMLDVWNSKRQQLRQVAIVPSRQWSSQPSTSSINGTSSEATSQPSLLGLSLRLCNPSQALLHVWHILEILEGSPAESAGLVPFGDFVIGWPGGVLQAEGDFYELVEAHTDRALRLYVYNSDYDHTREVIIVPNREWGGEGLLGCGVGYGLLHRIPKPRDLPKVPPALSSHEDKDQGIPEDQLKTPRIGAPPSAAATPAGNSRFEEDHFSTPLANPSGARSASQDHDYYHSSHDEEEEEDDYEANTSGVTVSMRHDDEDDEEEGQSRDAADLA
ncbi:related to GRH1-acetylated protein, involved in ER to Golgi transport [Ustilago bromivora]|uniref:Related to GRH1 - acetylated protein, involved in ER to Golgi transport n=1 Tax=Ustilago bromivora TaxID=307758 RepID=A0A1K0GZM9_9BASI|nr:related to GRH1-acetylated protein, involved in ER to Golgi transport [Ustilago bromivora]SYW79335.1 related to GRH1 - acetylated protein, involved in ER to Golgi transport [Ustilago bromivora]